jgi:flavin reductase (DIM6/NTAB) family NADH-FMN oxidoreductase RutF
MYRKLAGWLRRRLRPGATGHGGVTPIFMRVSYYLPRQVVLVTARHQGAENVWPMDWHTPISLEPQLYCIAATTGSYGAELVRASGAYVVNFVPASWEQAILLCGSTSGRTTDKFAQAGLAREQGKMIDAPRLAGALGALECRVEQSVLAGDHTLFIGRVLHSISRAEGPRLHHLDRRLKREQGAFERKPEA